MRSIACPVKRSRVAVRLLLFGIIAAALVACSPPSPAETPAPQAAPSADAAGPTVILVSLDGFRWDYQQLTEAPNLDALAARGVQAERLIPSFPSKTFPCHYTTVTGLYPGHHGIVSNNMRDPGWQGDFRLGTAELLESRWWGGEPIWNTAQRQGLVSASFFWPGSDVVIGGDRPRYYYTYDGSIPFEDRVAQVLAWLDLPAGERPSFITLYFAEPNEAAHRHGPEAPEALAAARRVDDMLGLLVDGLTQRDLLESTDIVVAADHGMTLMSEERVIVLDEYVELLPGELFEAGALLQIYPAEGREAGILAALQGAHPNLAVWHRDEIPERFRLRGSPRIAPIVGVPEVGWSVETRASIEGSHGRFLLGNHGGDPHHPDMAGIFIAAGPSFAEGVRVPAFENVEIYNLLARALNIEPAPNDGDLSRVPGILR